MDQSIAGFCGKEANETSTKNPWSVWSVKGRSFARISSPNRVSIRVTRDDSTETSSGKPSLDLTRDNSSHAAFAKGSAETS